VAESSSNSNGILAYLSKYAPRPVFDADGMCSAVLEALLIGHEDWVHSVQWKPQRGGGGGTKKPSLLSSSMDRTMMLWEPDVATGKRDINKSHRWLELDR
jgi:WD40 repeat protein